MNSVARKLLRGAAMWAGLTMTTTSVQAQGLVWARFETAPAFGNGNTATSQTLDALVSGAGRGSGTVALTLSVSGGSNAWNGFGIARNDDGYYSGPNQPLPGITFVNGAPGYGGGIPLLAAASFATGYNIAGAPAATPLPPSDRAAIYFDAADGTTAIAQWNFTGLIGATLPAGSWLFLDGIDQGERIVVTGPNGWIAAVHAGDSTLPRPASPVPLPVLVSSPTFPQCAPAVIQTATTLQLDGRYGDISGSIPACANVPVPVPGQTVGYTKGVDAVGIWIRTAIDVSTLQLSAIDSDPSTSNGMGGYTGPDNNFVMGLGLISRTQGVPAIPLPTLGIMALFLLSTMLILSGKRHLQRARS